MTRSQRNLQVSSDWRTAITCPQYSPLIGPVGQVQVRESEGEPERGPGVHPHGQHAGEHACRGEYPP